LLDAALEAERRTGAAPGELVAAAEAPAPGTPDRAGGTA
jgi:hypothetical protein